MSASVIVWSGAMRTERTRWSWRRASWEGDRMSMRLGHREESTKAICGAAVTAGYWAGPCGCTARAWVRCRTPGRRLLRMRLILSSDGRPATRGHQRRDGRCRFGEAWGLAFAEQATDATRCAIFCLMCSVVGRPPSLGGSDCGRIALNLAALAADSAAENGISGVASASLGGF